MCINKNHTLAKKQTLCRKRQRAREVCEESFLLYSPLLGCQQEHCVQVSRLHSMKYVGKSEDIQTRVEKDMYYVPNLNKRKLKGDKATTLNCSAGWCEEERNLFSNYEDFTKTVRKTFWQKEKHSNRTYTIYMYTQTSYVYKIHIVAF